MDKWAKDNVANAVRLYKYETGRFLGQRSENLKLGEGSTPGRRGGSLGPNRSYFYCSNPRVGPGNKNTCPTSSYPRVTRGIG